MVCVDIDGVRGILLWLEVLGKNFLNRFCHTLGYQGTNWDLRLRA